MMEWKRLDDLEDPLRFPWRYASPEDREVVALIAASFAFGNVRAMLHAIETVLDPLGPHPAWSLRAGKARIPPDFRYRYVRPSHVATLYRGLHAVLRKWERLGRLVRYLWTRTPPCPHPERLRRVMEGIYQALELPSGHPLLPDPSRRSALKRWCLLFRWMVRRDPPDLGIWTFIPPSALCIPLDVHIHRIALRRGWTRRTTRDWKTVLEVMTHLQRMNPEDPVFQDFAWYMEERRERFSKR